LYFEDIAGNIIPKSDDQLDKNVQLMLMQQLCLCFFTSSLNFRDVARKNIGG